jgi:hypothetical protein
MAGVISLFGGCRGNPIPIAVTISRNGGYGQRRTSELAIAHAWKTPARFGKTAGNAYIQAIIICMIRQVPQTPDQGPSNESIT